MTSMTRNINVATVVGAVALATALWSAPTLAADAILSGQVKRPDGKPLKGVTISAKAQGSSASVRTPNIRRIMTGLRHRCVVPQAN
jgi:hypothetical protein